jgi:STE24 endopeptidase
MGRYAFRVLSPVGAPFLYLIHTILTSQTHGRLRQYPLYSKTKPPTALANHFTPEVFEKSQKYGKDKAKFALFSGLYKQCLDSSFIQWGFNAWSWDVAGRILYKFGYGPQYEVMYEIFFKKGGY